MFLSIIHFYWAFGGKIGYMKAIPEIKGKPTVKPGFVITIIVAIFLLIFGAIAHILGFYNLTSNSYGKYVIYLGYFLSIIFILRAIGDFKLIGFFKTVKSSEFSKYDTLYYSPLCLSIGIVFLILSLGV